MITKNVYLPDAQRERGIFVPDIHSPYEKEAHENRSITVRESSPEKKAKKIRTAAYCRVSTNHTNQLGSIEMQVAHYKEMIQAHEDWELTEIYYEAGVSGTTWQSRHELNRLLEDCRLGKIDLILTKSISRFARNTADLLGMVRYLLSINVHILFEKEQIDTSKMEGELILTILASLAEDESFSISKNEKWSVSKRFSTGTYRYSTAPYGYDLFDGTFVINIDEACVIRYIFDAALRGKGSPAIARLLNEHHIPTKKGGDGKWHAGTILNILKNPVYTGDILMQKTFSKKEEGRFQRKANKGQLPKYVMEDHHASIISHETFQQVEQVIKQRGSEKNNQGNTSTKYIFTGKIICGCCQAPMKRTSAKRKSGAKHYRACKKHSKSCHITPVHEKSIENAFMTMLHKLQFAMELILDPYMFSLEGIQLEHARNLRKILLGIRKNPSVSFEDDLFLQIIDHVTVQDTHTLCFHLLCGLALSETI